MSFNTANLVQVLYIRGPRPPCDLLAPLAQHSLLMESEALPQAGECIASVTCTDDKLIVDLEDGSTISAPLAWFPRLLHAAPTQRNNWELAGGGSGIHWPDLDEDLSVNGLLRPHGRH